MTDTKFEWVIAANPPEYGAACLLATPSTDGTEWVYMFGTYVKEGAELDFGSDKYRVKKEGFYTYSEKLSKLLPIINTMYWTYIPEPSDISSELIITGFY